MKNNELCLDEILIRLQNNAFLKLEVPESFLCEICK